MATAAERAIGNNEPPEEVAKAAVQDAVAGVETDVEKEALAAKLYKEATGRFPQESSDRRSVYIGGFVLVGVVFLAVAAMSVIIVVGDRAVPDSISTLATALISGVIGGLFGYAQS